MRRVFIPVSLEFFERVKLEKKKMEADLGRVSWVQASNHFLNQMLNLRDDDERKKRRPLRV